jgi:hypothetical protein
LNVDELGMDKEDTISLLEVIVPLLESSDVT